MPRATVTDVRSVIETELSDSEISPYIDDAALEVQDRVPDSSPYTEARLKKLEKYLTAHLIRFLRERQEESYSIKSSKDSVSMEYSGAFGKGLSATAAGQVVLDTDYEDYFGGGDSGNSRTVGYVGSSNPAKN